jgi:Flp pilus assembly protein protease CpaA
VLGGALAIAVLIVRRYPIVVQFGKVFSARDMLPCWIHHGLVPYGVAISGAGLILLPIG